MFKEIIDDAQLFCLHKLGLRHMGLLLIADMHKVMPIVNANCLKILVKKKVLMAYKCKIFESTYMILLGLIDFVFLRHDVTINKEMSLFQITHRKFQEQPIVNSTY